MEPFSDLVGHCADVAAGTRDVSAPPSLRYLARLVTTYDHGCPASGVELIPIGWLDTGAVTLSPSGAAEESTQFRRWSATTNVDLTHR